MTNTIDTNVGDCPHNLKDCSTNHILVDRTHEWSQFAVDIHIF